MKVNLHLKREVPLVSRKECGAWGNYCTNSIKMTGYVVIVEDENLHYVSVRFMVGHIT